MTWETLRINSNRITMPRKTGQPWPAGPWGMQAGSNGTITLDRLYAIPMLLYGTQNFDLISVNGLGTASSFIRLGVYAPGVDGAPGELLADYGQVATSSSGVCSIAIKLSAGGLIWVAAVGQGVAPSTTRLGTAVINPFVAPSNHYSVSFTAICYSQNSVSGALPVTWGSTYNVEATANTVPMVWLRSVT